MVFKVEDGHLPLPDRLTLMFLTHGNHRTECRLAFVQPLHCLLQLVGAGVTKHLWKLDDLLDAAFEAGRSN